MLLLASVLSVALACTCLGVLRLGAPRWTCAILGLLPPALLLLASPGLRVHGYHGFVQAGIAYQLLLGHVPPTSPLLAGEPGTYPWVGALVLAGLSKALGVSPFWSAAIVTISSLAVLLGATYRIGLAVTGDADASLLGTVAALYAFTFTQSVPNSPLKDALTAALPFAYQEPRGAPILEKFNGCTAFPLGLALYALALLILLRMARREAPEAREMAALAASLAGVAFVYPFLFPALAILVLVAGVQAWRAGGAGRRLAVGQAGTLALVALAALPYYAQLARGRSAPAFELGSVESLPRQLGVLLVTLLPMTLLVLWAHRAVIAALRAHGRPAWLLLASGALNVVLFTFVAAPLWTQYKFLLLGILAFGITGGVALRTLRDRSWTASLAVLSAFLLPFGLDCVHKAQDWNEPRVFRESGMALEHLDPDARALDVWMRTTTDPGAVFVDADPGVPVYGQRALYVSVPRTREIAALTTRGGDGYTLDPRLTLLAVDGYPEALVERRIRTATALLVGDEVTPAELAEVRAAGTHAYVVWRRPARPTGRPAFPVVFENAAATVADLSR